MIMGNQNSRLSQELLNEYSQLTYLTKSEILYVLEKFAQIPIPRQINSDDILLHYRHLTNDVIEQFPQLKYNPFQDRIFRVFSSMNDDRLSFEDFLDLSSAMSINCPVKVKAAWAFKIFDIDEDNQITKCDLLNIIDRLTNGSELKVEEKSHICDVLLKEMDLQNSGGLSQLEFLHAITKMPEFSTTFSFRL